MIDVKEAIAVLKQFKEESQKHKDSYTPIGSNLSSVLKIMQDTYQKNIDAFEMAIQALERTRWIPVSERLPTKDDANSKGKIIAWCTSFNGTEVELNWRLVETSGVITHWRVGMEPPKGVE